MDQAVKPPSIEPRRNFSVRLPPGLYEKISDLKGSGRSMNDLICDAVANYVASPELSPLGASDINTQIACDGVQIGPEAIPALKGIAKHCSNKDQVALACVLWVAAARLVRDQSGAAAAAQELHHSAQTAEASKRFEVAVSLWRQALRLDPNLLEAENRLGQRLHHQASRAGDDIEQYREAERRLSRVTFVDNHAKLFHGWSLLFVAKADDDPYRKQQALTEIDEALKAWAFGQRQPGERERWFRQLRRLHQLGFETQAAGLIEFANRNSSWAPLGPDALSVSVDTREEEDG